MVFLNAGVDIKFLQKAEQTVSNPHFIPRNNNFTIKHYAGDVTYDVDGMYDYMYIHAGHVRCSAAPSSVVVCGRPAKKMQPQHPCSF
jgi:hypothetical protein